MVKQEWKWKHLTAANITALTIYDMVKAVDKTMKITDLESNIKRWW